ncbi:MAG: Coenzyme F420 hydrogenase/dehydrogenase, beta subunit C-terminal domain [Ruminococcus flavefaciens]|nr:Coenzyme F420 hydrogenase/dehydrogenase, beta subunit C-terminal domain [Ruminococcus flavefaciens]
MTEKVNCYGCGACSAVCPVNAVSFGLDKQGFYIPQVSMDKCIKCRKCINVCPMDYQPETRKKEDFVQQYYSVYADDKRCMKSASGGLFQILSEFVLSRGGVICGAVYDLEDNTVNHIVAGISDVHKIYGSKYVQSYISADVLKRIKHELDSGKYVLFSGTPCQIAGLYNFIGNNPERLFTVDIVCHGVSSYGLWNKFISEEFADTRFSSVCFRSKDKQMSAEEGYCLKIVDRYGKVYEERADKCSYYKAYFSGLSIGINCHRCPFAQTERLGDITIGDYIPADPKERKGLNPKGNSLAVINSTKGQWLFEESVSSAGDIHIHCTDIRNAVSHNFSMYKPSVSHAGRKHFFSAVEKSTLKNAVSESLRKKYDALVFSGHSDGTPESVLRSIAINSLFGSLGMNCAFMDVPDFILPECSEYHFKKNNIQKLLYRDVSVLSPVSDRQMMTGLNYITKMFILVGSPVWDNTESDTCYLFDFVNADIPRLALGLELGDRLERCDDELRELFYDRFYEFDFLSLSSSEQSAELSEILDTDVMFVPELILIQPPELYFSYGRKCSLTENYAVILNDVQLKENPCETLYILENSDKIITDSYAVMLLCMMSGKSFCITDDNDKIRRILRIYGLENRICTDGGINFSEYNQDVKDVAVKIAEDREKLLSVVAEWIRKAWCS